MLIMFASICLIYLIRIWRDVEILTYVQNRINFSYFVLSAKIILTTGICISLYKRLQVAVSIRQAYDAEPNERVSQMELSEEDTIAEDDERDD